MGRNENGDRCWGSCGGEPGSNMIAEGGWKESKGESSGNQTALLSLRWERRGTTGVEPVTACFTDKRSNQLSYVPSLLLLRPADEGIN